MKLIRILLVSFFLISLTVNYFAAEKINSAPETVMVQHESSGHNSAHGHPMPNAWMVLPFVMLLLMIATGPLFYRHFWEHNYPKISIFLGLITVTYYLAVLHDSLSLLHTLAEYISFIALLASLFVASGGILIKIEKKATPMLNAAILLFGALIANVIGTTGASMLLIRPFMKINQNRIKAYHIIFFIFLVSNIGGALTPIGDPPLFLGFLRGIDFFWFVEHVWYIWIPAVLLVLVVFYFVDSRNTEGSSEEEEYSGKFIFQGWENVGYLLVILISVFIDPAVMSWVPSLAPMPFGIREIIMGAVILVSYKRADKKVLEANEFDFEPIKEVAFLFIGIFATMIPALQLISQLASDKAEKLTAGIFYWGTGVLSGFLDNAPTFLNFLSAAMGKFGLDVNNVQEVHHFELVDPIYLQAISVAAVFFGAMSYIGNGPNFMVKSISERAGVKMPSFFGYIVKYSLPILIPIFIVIWLIFFFARG